MKVILFLIKLPFKILALSVVTVLTVAVWFAVFITSFSSIIFNLFAGICFVTAVLGYMTGVCSGSEARICLISGFVRFVILHVAGVAIIGVDGVNLALWDFIKS